MRKNIQRLGAMCLLAAVVLLAGCTKEALLPKASGRPYEVLVVMDDQMWNAPAGRALFDVWYMGCKWRCAKTGTKTAPAWNNTDWAMVEGNPQFTVEFADTDYIFDPDRFALTLTIIARLYNMDIQTIYCPQMCSGRVTARTLRVTSA